MRNDAKLNAMDEPRAFGQNQFPIEEEGLTPSAAGFARDILRGESGIRAVLNNYNVTNPKIAGQMASKILRRKRIVDYLERHGLGAARRVEELAKNAKQEDIRLRANKDILDRIGVGVHRGPQVAVPIQINFSGDREQFE